ncbi:MAG: hypothetical protein D6784_16675 [Chloroflexi bacterium]|nr:MAG: hypothetical protein D6784_16675 [Chloroflexota bacterium]
MTHHSTLAVDSLILTRNDVLFDVRGSYHAAVARAVQVYLEQAVGLPMGSRPLLTPEEAGHLYYFGGFSRYIDALSTLVIYFLEKLPPVPTPTYPVRFHIPAMLAYLQLAGQSVRIGVDTLGEQKDIPRLAADIAAAGGGLTGMEAVLPRSNRHLLVDEGSITRINVLGRVFQELYLGTRLFSRVYGEPAMLVAEEGYIHRESLRMDPDILNRLAERLPLALIALESRRKEIEDTLERHGIRHCFQVLITEEEVEANGMFQAGDPWPLLEAARRLQPAPSQVGVVAATPDDIRAARSANKTIPFISIAAAPPGIDKPAWQARLEQTKANMVIGHPDHLKELILG